MRPSTTREVQEALQRQARLTAELLSAAQAAARKSVEPTPKMPILKPLPLERNSTKFAPRSNALVFNGTLSM